MTNPPLTPQIKYIPSAPESHAFYKFSNSHEFPQAFRKAWKRDSKILKSSLPSGIHVKLFEDRMDLMSVMITGPPETPYDGCLFFFDVQLPFSYPHRPPRVRYIKFHDTPTQIHPNIFFDGAICLSLLNQSVRHVKSYSMFWITGKSTLLQLFVSLQGLVLAKDPVNNIAFRASTNDRSKEFNSVALTNVIRSMTSQISQPPTVFQEETLQYYRETGMNTYEKLQGYTRGFVECGESSQKRKKVEEPPFPLQLPIPEDLVQNFHSELEKILD